VRVATLGWWHAHGLGTAHGLTEPVTRDAQLHLTTGKLCRVQHAPRLHDLAMSISLARHVLLPCLAPDTPMHGGAGVTTRARPGRSCTVQPSSDSATTCRAQQQETRRRLDARRSHSEPPVAAVGIFSRSSRTRLCGTTLGLPLEHAAARCWELQAAEMHSWNELEVLGDPGSCSVPRRRATELEMLVSLQLVHAW
jgi:hypothetical protein